MTQLDRIERKLDWLRWRLREGDTMTIGVTPDHYPIIVSARGPEPDWPEDK